MELQSLKSFELLNKETVRVITGGTARKDTKKGDVTSTSQDSKNRYKTPKLA